MILSGPFLDSAVYIVSIEGSLVQWSSLQSLRSLLLCLCGVATPDSDACHEDALCPPLAWMQG